MSSIEEYAERLRNAGDSRWAAGFGIVESIVLWRLDLTVDELRAEIVKVSAAMDLVQGEHDALTEQRIGN